MHMRHKTTDTVFDKAEKYFKDNICCWCTSTSRKIYAVGVLVLQGQYTLLVYWYFKDNIRCWCTSTSRTIYAVGVLVLQGQYMLLVYQYFKDNICCWCTSTSTTIYAVGVLVLQGQLGTRYANLLFTLGIIILCLRESRV